MINRRLAEKLKNDVGVSVASVLLPKSQMVDMTKWSVVACDQYTSEQSYWEEVKALVGDNPSTLWLIFPEAYLETDDENSKTERIKAIHAKMEEYLKDGLFDELEDTVILVERQFPGGNSRHGLILAVDLERYDYSAGSRSLIRATEGTILERIPPRIRIRENAPLELPHVLLLIDDRNETVIEPLFARKDHFPKVYDFQLMKKGGSIRGWAVQDEACIENIYQALLRLSDPGYFSEKYGLTGQQAPLLFAVGDGNHSLATAKACWEKLKATLSPEERENHPARFALVEVVNLHDKGLIFEPIHRILFRVDKDRFIQDFCRHYNALGFKTFATTEKPSVPPGSHVIGYVSEGSDGYLVVEKPSGNLDVATLQGFIDVYLKENPGTAVDYVHGSDVVERLGRQKGNMGFFLSPMDKNELFRTVILDGALPRKTFSMGEANEKRFYLEARRIR
ncbi:MAG TPA: DUF1015 domain-containing protein [Thermoclostridium caenicola]|nr:DUF1015 domain-containing protein [Thermoclostridium caenicola]